MSFTKRGRALLFIVAFSIAMAVLYGPRSLNAVVVPGVVALAVAIVYVRRTEQPEIDRIPPEDGPVGATKTVRLDLRTRTSFTGRLIDTVGDGLLAVDNDQHASIDSGPISYDVTYDRRGVHTIGPTSITVRDVLGLAERTYRYHNEHEILVYPPVRDLTGRARHELNLLPEIQRSAMRNEFDSLREYERGDAFRDIHWKTSAKRPDDELVVKEYSAEDDLGTITLIAEAEGGLPAADAMAEAAASIASFLLAAGLTIEVSAPEGILEADDGRSQRRKVLELFARTGPGSVPKSERVAADVLITADADGDVVVQVDDRTVSFDRLVGHTTDSVSGGGGPPESTFEPTTANPSR